MRGITISNQPRGHQKMHQELPGDLRRAGTGALLLHHGAEHNQLWCNAGIMQPAWCMTGAQRSADRVITYHWAPGGRSSYLAWGSTRYLPTLYQSDCEIGLKSKRHNKRWVCDDRSDDGHGDASTRLLRNA